MTQQEQAAQSYNVSNPSELRSNATLLGCSMRGSHNVMVKPVGAKNIKVSPKQHLWGASFSTRQYISLWLYSICLPDCFSNDHREAFNLPVKISS